VSEELHYNAAGLLRGLLLQRRQSSKYRLMHKFGAADDPTLGEYLHNVVPLGGWGLRTDHDVDGTPRVK
jgi:hypothetical protein